ncbi:hypothetical protein [Brevibacillus daliensis]|uniref:hypothetical protein n=1 Tax=Brevibacillus daliensis TaxID=2892995 RepID=UPI001E63077F|nr:hypothetical protein [Brevibacillus daliensis]
MRKSTAKRILKEYPEFEQWLRKKPSRVAKVLSNPEEIGRYLGEWEAEKKRKRLIPIVDLDNISQKTRMVNEKLTSLQSFLDLLSDNKEK